MNVIWERAPVTAEEVIRRLREGDASWHFRTVKTYLGRLVQKKVLAFQKQGRAYLYRPLVSREECVEAASRGFLNLVFGGSLKPMLAYFVEHKKLSAKEVRELKAILEKES